MAKCGLGHHEVRLDVRVEGPAPLREVELLDSSQVLLERGVVHQHIQSP